MLDRLASSARIGAALLGLAALGGIEALEPLQRAEPQGEAYDPNKKWPASLLAAPISRYRSVNREFNRADRRRRLKRRARRGYDFDAAAFRRKIEAVSRRRNWSVGA